MDVREFSQITKQISQSYLPSIQYLLKSKVRGVLIPKTHSQDANRRAAALFHADLVPWYLCQFEEAIDESCDVKQVDYRQELNRLQIHRMTIFIGELDSADKVSAFCSPLFSLMDAPDVNGLAALE
jgi:hypothetical protein